MLQIHLIEDKQDNQELVERTSPSCFIIVGWGQGSARKNTCSARTAIHLLFARPMASPGEHNLTPDWDHLEMKFFVLTGATLGQSPEWIWPMQLSPVQVMHTQASITLDSAVPQ